MNMSNQELSDTLEVVINNTKIFDIHTHLFPSAFKSHSLSGFINLLNYHYLIAELLTNANISAEKFYSLDDVNKAKLIWEELFQNRTPISEACKGVLTVLQKLDINYNNKTFEELKNEYENKSLTDEKILKLSNVSSLVMTNNPFDIDEWNLYKDNDWDRNIFQSSLRLDDLIINNSQATEVAKNQTKINQKQNDIVINYLDSCFLISNPVYAAISANSDNFKEILNDPLWKLILSWLNKKNIPLSLMLGVKRAVNSSFGLAGDGIGDINLKELSKLCNSFPENKFLVTCLSLNDQHELTVLARKHPNLKIFGFWWFMNQPTIIKQILKMRIDMLGFSFIPQHSDARVSDQLIYKWSHFKKILHPILLEYYQDLLDKNFPISENILQRDIDNLLSLNAKKYLGIK